MPCESCHVQFTVFRRKRSCADCKRFYCSNCLTTTKRRTITTNNVHVAAPGAQLCRRCLIFAKRPLLRTDLLQLRPKDLIFYLQSKHISTTGCVEKDELVGLVLSHVHQIDAAASESTATNCTSDDGSGSARNYTESAPHSFDSIKQTCQSFFTSITENISDSLNSFDNKTYSPKPSARGENKGREARSGRGSTDSDASIFDQPRVSTRELPSYASFQQQQSNHNNYHITQATTVTTTTSTSEFVPFTTRTTTATETNFTTSPTFVSSGSVSQSSVGPEISISSIDRALAVIPQYAPTLTNQPQHIELKALQVAIEISDCECSDDELLATFSERSLAARKTNEDSSTKESTKNLETDERVGNKSRASTDINFAEISSHSSFEELGAIGGISDESKAATDTNSSNLEQWQILDTAITLQTSGSPLTEQSSTVACASAVPVINSNMHTDDTITDIPKDLQVAIPTRQAQQPGQALCQPVPSVSQRVKKVTRRRSESYLNRLRQRPTSEDDSPTSNQASNMVYFTLDERGVEDIVHNASTEANETDDALVRLNNVCRKRVIGGSGFTTNCQRCGKHKATLRKQVEKMRRHLESAQLSEEEIKKELKDFLSYLELRSISMECSDTETVGSSLSGRNYGVESPGYAQSTQSQQQQQQQRIIWDGASMSPWDYQLDDNEGIHVYAGTSSDMSDYNGQSSRFINLDDFETIDDLENLSVKQLKEILMLNRVDYKGCCEKQELLERAQRLWKNSKSAPAVDKLPTDELCKICMDAPIECVILECGHMATCTSCGKVLSECPICRQYIVRVVRFFRA